MSDNLIGPYVDKGLCWPTNGDGRGHNVTALMLPDGRYAVAEQEYVYSPRIDAAEPFVGRHVWAPCPERAPRSERLLHLNQIIASVGVAA